MFESVDAHARTDTRMPARVPSYKLTLWAFGSGELKTELFWKWKAKSEENIPTINFCNFIIKFKILVH